MGYYNKKTIPPPPPVEDLNFPEGRNSQFSRAVSQRGKGLKMQFQRSLKAFQWG